MKFEARSRWSFAVRCARMAGYAMRGAEPVEPDPETQGFFRRGHQLEDDVYQSFVQRYGSDDLIRHKPIPWPGGIAHGDIYVKSERLAVEVKSTADQRPLDYHLLQLAGQIEFDPDAQHGALVMVNPSNLTRRVLPMPAVPDELRERVHEVAAAVARTADPAAPLPDRVCDRPSDAIGRMCPFADLCFTGWQPPDPAELQPDVAHLAAELQAADRAVKDARKHLAGLEEDRDVVRAELRRTIEPAVEYVAADDELVVRVTPVPGRVTWDIASAIELGVIGKALLEPFRREGSGYERWTVKTRPVLVDEQAPGRVLAGLAVDVDYGEVPF